ncbi:MAG TPA: hypothetical protein VLT15_10040 [Acidimicrobiia bacterium]|nr:hypothetical protein [Acidimicrobiia bacterium]
MRIALAASGSLGLRSGRVLLADARIGSLGVLGRQFQSQDSRVVSIDSLDGWDLVVSDASPGEAPFEEALRTGIPLISPHTAEELAEVAGSAPMLAAASPRSGLPAALVIEAMGRLDAVTAASVAITVPARRIPHRFAVSFPTPVGGLWSERTDAPVSIPNVPHFFEAPYDGPLFGITVSAEGTIAGESATVVRGIVDDPEFLAAIALAGAALMLIDGALPDGTTEVQDEAACYLEACAGAGMGVASFNPGS